MQHTILAVLVLSLILNTYLARVAYSQRKKLKADPKKQLTVDARMLLSELTSGEAIVKIIPVDTSNLLMWRD